MLFTIAVGVVCFGAGLACMYHNVKNHPEKVAGWVAKSKDLQARLKKAVEDLPK